MGSDTSLRIEEGRGRVLTNDGNTKNSEQPEVKIFQPNDTLINALKPFLIPSVKVMMYLFHSCIKLQSKEFNCMKL